MTEIIFATENAGKIREVEAMFEGLGVSVKTMKEAGIRADIIEDGSTFMENAVKKAKTIAGYTKEIVLADDSGLVIDHLNGEPGIYSARYLGEDTPYEIKNAELLSRMEGVEETKRSARFVCAMAAVMPDGEVLQTEGVMEGIIGYEAAGENGFGYDPIFYLPEFGMSSAQISSEQKNAVSHRGKALRKMQKLLQNKLRS
ncbi:MAG: XTP/dITP diphosphatase [Lachnospiraceae bacterium]|nr:XTP/dITP diphosphatase [Lachnospiraceae bacterium]